MQHVRNYGPAFGYEGEVVEKLNERCDREGRQFKVFRSDVYQALGYVGGSRKETN